MNNIPTPRTNAEWNNLDGQWHERAVKLCHFTQELERELFTTREQLLESESARNRNFQSASEALKTVAKLSAKLETCTLQTEQYSRIMLKALAELANKTANLAHADTKICELQDFIKTQSAELTKVKAERDEADSALRVLAHAEREEWDAASAHYHEADRLAIIALSTIPPVYEPEHILTKGGDELCPTKCNSVSFVEDSTTDSAVQTLSRVSNAAQMSDPSAAAMSVCVPVEVLAKLVKSVEDYFKLILASDYSGLVQLGHKIDEALALAAPFLAKGDK